MSDLRDFIENNDRLDAEEKMTLLTDSIHSLFRGYANAAHAHKESHLKCLEELKKAEKLIEDQAIQLQKKQTEVNTLIEHISYAVYYMKQAGYQNYESSNPEFQMYNELKTILDVAKFSHKKD